MQFIKKNKKFIILGLTTLALNSVFSTANAQYSTNIAVNTALQTYQTVLTTTSDNNSQQQPAPPKTPEEIKKDKEDLKIMLLGYGLIVALFASGIAYETYSANNPKKPKKDKNKIRL